jgi:hypothetical protein
MNQKALYITNTFNIDFNIIQLFPTINEIIIINTQNIINCDYNNFNKQYIYYYHQNQILSTLCPCLFRKLESPSLTNLKNRASHFNMILETETSNMLRFKYNNQYITFIYNIHIPNKIYKIQNYIYNFTDLILIDCDLHQQILNYTTNKITLWTTTTLLNKYNTDTLKKQHYKKNQNDLQIYYSLLFNNHTHNKFHKFNLIDNQKIYYFSTFYLLLHFSHNL